MSQQELFDSAPNRPEGFVYEPGFISREQEAALVKLIQDLPLQEAKYKDYTARRRTMSYGSAYDYGKNALDPAPAIPAFLMPLRERVAEWAALPPEKFVQGLVSEYRPGTPLGWHRDVPNFEVIVGVSLGAACRMRLRPYRPGLRNRREEVITVELEPRSALHAGVGSTASLPRKSCGTRSRFGPRER
jgi:alkylated DNA repair dioxygenase AlkB